MKVLNHPVDVIAIFDKRAKLNPINSSIMINLLLSIE